MLSAAKHLGISLKRNAETLRCAQRDGRRLIHRSSVTGDYGCFNDAIEMMNDSRFRADALVTRRIALDELIERGLRTLIEEKSKHVKILVSPRP